MEWSYRSRNFTQSISLIGCVELVIGFVSGWSPLFTCCLINVFLKWAHSSFVFGEFNAMSRNQNEEVAGNEQGAVINQSSFNSIQRH